MIILGSTGSIGVSTLSVALELNLRVDALVAGYNVALLNAQILQCSPRYVVVAEESLVARVRHPRVLVGEDGIAEVMQRCENVKLVVNALVGFFGLRFTLLALKLGKQVALANKESLVAAGAFIDSSALIPIDSEHFALRYLLRIAYPVKRMVIMASGGALRDVELSHLARISPSEALCHPNWDMGPKITIDSATMTNKLFELLEARWLFGPCDYDALIEPHSVVHAMVCFEDGSSTLHLAHADMKLPIAFALSGKTPKNVIASLDMTRVHALSFSPIDPMRYPIWEAKSTLLDNPKLGVVMNAANEIGVAAFLNGKRSIVDIATLSLRALNHFHHVKVENLEDVFAIDREVRDFCESC